MQTVVSRWFYLNSGNLCGRSHGWSFVRQRSCMVHGPWIIACLLVVLGCSVPATDPVDGGDLVPPIQSSDVEIEVDEPSGANPVSIGAVVVPATVGPGELVTLLVRAKLASGWHIYAADRESGPTVATTLELQLPAGVEKKGDWQCPEPELYETVLGATYIYHDTADFLVPLRVADDAAGNLRIACEFGYQACNDDICHVPTRQSVSVDLSVVSTP